jgi:6,7-dimethyl-8-ribityllumazine synthase
MTSTTNQNEILNTDNLRIPTHTQVVLIYTEWNTDIINELRNGAKKILSNYPQIGVVEIKVPGAIELTYAIAKMQKKLHISRAFIALGCVIKGETPHFDYVCQSVTQGITLINAQANWPVVFGILTVNNEKEAYDRLGGKHGHKGEDAAIAALKMIDLYHTILK